MLFTMAIERADGIIDICEMKYSANLRNKKAVFQYESKTKKAIATVMITTFGLKDNEYSREIENGITMDDLFVK